MNDQIIFIYLSFFLSIYTHNVSCICGGWCPRTEVGWHTAGSDIHLFHLPNVQGHRLVLRGGPLAPVIAAGECEEFPITVEASNTDGHAIPRHLLVQSLARVLVPDTDPAVGSRRAEGALDRMHVNGADAVDPVVGVVPVAFERELAVSMHPSMHASRHSNTGVSQSLSHTKPRTRNTYIVHCVVPADVVHRAAPLDAAEDEPLSVVEQGHAGRVGLEQVGELAQDAKVVVVGRGGGGGGLAQVEHVHVLQVRGHDEHGELDVHVDHGAGKAQLDQRFQRVTCRASIPEAARPVPARSEERVHLRHEPDPGDGLLVPCHCVRHVQPLQRGHSTRVVAGPREDVCILYSETLHYD